MIKQIASLAAAFLICAGVCIHSYALTEDGVSAKAAVVYQPDTHKLMFRKNIGEKLPMASTTKIMTTLLLAESGDLDTPFTVDPVAVRTEGSSMGLLEGDTVTGRALCAGMLLPSGNDAANVTAVHLGGTYEKFAELMNFRASLIGMKNTHFVTPSGLHDDDHYSTAYDMALLAAEALENPTFAEICSSQTLKVNYGNPPYDRWLKNTNKLLGMCEGCKGVKTGFTDEAGRCLVSACERDGVTLICVTLNDPNDWQDHINMYEDAFSRITPIEIDIGALSEAVAGSSTEKISVRCSEKIVYPAADGKAPEFSFNIVMPPFLYAPVNSGDCVGKVQVTADGALFGEYDLCAEESAEYLCVSEDSGTLGDKIKKIFTR